MDAMRGDAMRRREESVAVQQYSGNAAAM